MHLPTAAASNDEMASFPGPFPEPDPDPAPDPDPVPIPGPGEPGLDPGFPIETPVPAPLT